MKVILISDKHGGSRSIELGRWSRALVSLCCLGFPLGMIAIGYLAGQESAASAVRGAALDTIQEGLDKQSSSFDALQNAAELKLQALTINLAELQARMTRLDALGEHLTAMADLGDGEFDFSQPPAVGGPLAGEYNVDFSNIDLSSELKLFGARLDDREEQLGILGSLFQNRKLADDTWVSGLPVRKGWISSPYGTRTDPFTGRKSVHTGIDFAGKAGSDVLAVASGVVTWTGREAGYGNMVEISHGDGYVTRYAHNKENLVAAGDLVHKGDPIALIGSTGRATGSHVHYEVYKHGRPVDPSSYVRRTRR
ncbi:MAG: M23 family metallopeptidase [Pseudomonadales bacterium]|nr:M23 family metallopeptidase [Halioglobus sp.]MCP5131467.1 M23 family metallopeptidase [Pseudomonadales bacterium]